MDDFVRYLDGVAHDLPKRITGSVSTTKDYAIFVELGTSRMDPRAMVRQSEPVIEAEQDLVTKAIASTFPPTERDLMIGANAVIDCAYNEIVKNTPRSTIEDEGYVHLQDDWLKEEAQAHD